MEEVLESPCFDLLLRMAERPDRIRRVRRPRLIRKRHVGPPASSAPSHALRDQEQMEMNKVSGSLRKHFRLLFVVALDRMTRSGQTEIGQRAPTFGRCHDGRRPAANEQGPSRGGDGNENLHLHEEGEQSSGDIDGTDDNDDNNSPDASNDNLGQEKLFRYLACPYLKRYPDIFHNQRPCAGPGWPTTSRLK
jgi:hypothetical protein